MGRGAGFSPSQKDNFLHFPYHIYGTLGKQREDCLSVLHAEFLKFLAKVSSWSNFSFLLLQTDLPVE